MVHKILINSYTCCPGMGSEKGMGWNWIVSIAKYCELYVISEGEFRNDIEAWMDDEANQEIADRMHFYWNPVSDVIRSMCWNQGDWRFYKYYRQWQKKTADIARLICSREKIDILHQLNMIGFREPGYLWQVSRETGIPFVWGPIGGLKQFPIAYTEGGGVKMKLFFQMKNIINVLQLKFDPRVNAALSQSSLLISSIPDSYNALKKSKGKESVIIPETGCFTSPEKDTFAKTFDKEVMDILWVGKFDFRKRLDIAIRAIAMADNSYLKLHVYGGGSEHQIRQAKALVVECGIDSQVFFHGNQPHEFVEKAMRQADLFLFTSVNEDTSTVVIEALGSHLPVVCFDTCGMAYIIDDQVGTKVPLTCPEDSVRRIAAIINGYCSDRSFLKRQSLACRERQKSLSWDEKGRKVVELYKSLWR